jgi:DNA-binding PadR family transcriptional regulator
MRLSMHYMWPRAESNVYAEPKRLVDDGLATAREEWTGSRRRTIYSITAAGRKELRKWLAAPSAHERFESEALIKVLFAENGTLSGAITAVRSLRADAVEAIEHFLEVADEYAAGRGRYPGRFALSAVAGRLVLEQQAATARWATWAEETLTAWQDPLSRGADEGISTMRGVGEPLPITEDPVRQLLERRSR